VVWVAVLEVILLVTAVVFVPAAVIGQDPEAPPAEKSEPEAASEPSPAPVAEQPTETGPPADPAPDAAPQDPTPEGPKAEEPKPEEPKPRAEPEGAAEPEQPAEPKRDLLILPDPVELKVGESAALSAWTCIAGANPPFGEDRQPGTADDTCAPIEAEWTLNDAGAMVASLGKDEAARTKVTAGTTTDDAAADDVAPRIIARAAGLEARSRLKLGAPEPQPKAEEPKAEEPKAEEPKAEEPKSEEPKAEEPGGRAKGDEPKEDGQPNADGPKDDQPAGDGPKTDEHGGDAQAKGDELAEVSDTPVSDEGSVTGEGPAAVSSAAPHEASAAEEPPSTGGSVPADQARDLEPSAAPEESPVASDLPLPESDQAPDSPRPVAEESASPVESQQPVESAVSMESPVPVESPNVAAASPITAESALPFESPLPVAEESPLPDESSSPAESPLPLESSLPVESAAPVESPLSAADQDGVAATVEAAAPDGGDGDTDGIADDVQANVVSLPAAVDLNGNGLLDDYVTIESPPGTLLLNVMAVPVPSDPAPPDDIAFPVGLFDYEVVVANPGDSAAVTFHLPDGVVVDPATTAFWVVQNGEWSDLTAQTVADPVANELTVALVDGGAGDEDRIADGVIEDPGGPGLPGDDWSLTITVQAPANPAATFDFFLEECAETEPDPTPCTPQAPERQWVDHLVVDGPTLPGTAITPVEISHGQSFTWANLDTERHYRLIEVGTDSPPDTGTGSPPAGWAITGYECDSVGATLLESDSNSFTGFLSTVVGEDTNEGWATCTVFNDLLAEPRTGSTITARKWGDRASNNVNQPLPGATMGLWRDNGDGNFQPTGADAPQIATCTTGADGTCAFSGLTAGPYWVMEVSPPAGGTWNAILNWAPGSSSAANPSVPYAAHRNGDPAADRTNPPASDGYPIVVNGTDTKETDFFADRRTNPPIDDFTCQALMRIVLVLDRSGSIQSNGAANYNNAVQGFVNDLVGTNTDIGIVSFGPDATTDSPYFNVQGGSAGTLLTTINTIYTTRLGGGTNWDAGLALVDAFDPNPDLVVLVTDGNPTLNRVQNSDNGTYVNWPDFTEAVTTANLLKSGDSRVIAVAAGAANTISVEGLIGITGPLTNQPSALDDDYIMGTPQELADALREIALARCSASLDIEKQSVGGTATFDYAVNGSGLVPFTRDTAVANPTTSPPFDFTFTQFGQKDVQELPEAGWTLTNIVCTANGAVITIGTGIGGTFAQGATIGFDPGDTTVRAVLTADDAPTCTFMNTQHASLDIEKQSVGGTATFDYAVDGVGLTPFTRDTAVANPTTNPPFTFTIPQFGTKDVQELPETDWTLTDITCTANGADITIGTGIGGTFAQGATAGFDLGDTTVRAIVDAGDAPTCLFTNTLNASLDIEKLSVGGTATFDFIGTGTGVPPAFSRDTTVSNPTTSAPFAFDGFQLGSKTVTETVPAGWTLTNIVCTGDTTGVLVGADADFDPGDTSVSVPIDAGDDVSCTFTNTQNASLDIEKLSVGGTSIFDFAGSGTSVPPAFTRNTGFRNPTTIPPIDFTALQFGTKDVQEIPEPDFALTDIACTANGADITIGTGIGGTFAQGATAGFDSGDTTVRAVVDAGDEPTCLFTNTKLATKSGTKFEDLNADGDISGDPALGSAVQPFTIYLLSADGTTLIDSDMTDASGAYDLTGIQPGVDHLVCESAETDWFQSFPIAGSGDCSIVDEAGLGIDVEDEGYLINLAAGEMDTGNDFGNWRFATKTGSKYEDQNGDGDLSDGVPVEGITINLVVATNGEIGDTDTTDAAGVYSFDQLMPGTAYLICESSGAPTWTQSFPANTVCASQPGMEPGGHAITLASGQVDSGNDFGNWLPAMIIVEKQTLPNGSAQAFTFSGDAAGSITDGAQIVVDGLQGGTYMSTEVVPAGWDLTSIVCDDQDSTGDVGTATATFRLQPGERIVCVFTNTQRGSILVEKQTDPPGAAQAFAFTGTAAGSISDNGRIRVDDLVPGTYTSTETVPPSWVLGSIACDDGASLTPSSGDVGSRTATFRLDPGETALCVFTNSEARLSILKSATPGYFAAVGDIITYTITSTNTGFTTLTGVTVSDPMLPSLICVPAVPATLAPGASVSCSAIYTITQADLDRGSVPNSACATSAQTPTPVCDSVTVREITLDVLKTADDLSIPAGGQDVTFTFTVTNTSAVPLQILSLQDDVFGTLEGDADCRVGTILQPGASCEFEATFRVESDAAQDLDPDEDLPDHVDTLTVCVASPAGSVSAAADQAVVCDSDPETIEFERDAGGAGAGGGGQPKTDMLPLTDARSMTLGLDERTATLAVLMLIVIAILASGGTIRRETAPEPTRRRQR
jgi:uncharacterized repeat protein (TIGR01451 family)